MKKSIQWRLAAVIVVACVSMYFILANSINTGLDLAGGAHYTLEVMTDGLSDVEKKDVMEQTLSVYRGRIDEIGVAATTVQQAGDNRIIVQIPGVGGIESDRIKRILLRQAHLDFKIVIDGPGEPILEELDTQNRG